ncbi:MAG: hypothetical protein KDK08_27880 [Rhizobiaceae bacterium]|nr:hypothetical protein [Rhizobiaceae bacterium]
MVTVGVVMGLLAIFAGANHPTGGNDTIGCVLKGAVTLIIAGIASLILFVLIPSSARAAEAPPFAMRFCAPWDELKRSLARRYHEVPIGGGVVDRSTIARLLASPDGATWTLVTIDTSGMACMKGTGTGWEPGQLPIREKRT